MKSLIRALANLCLILVSVAPLTQAQTGRVMERRTQPKNGIHSDAESLYPVGYANIYFFIVGTTGINSAPTDIIECGATNVSGTDAQGNCYVTSNADGYFDLNDTFECPNDDADTTPAYFVAKNASYEGNANNPQYTQLLAMPTPYTCGYLQEYGATIIISDFTTVAAAFEAAPFANSTATAGDGFGTITTNSGDQAAIMAAFTDADSLAAHNTGLYPGSNSDVLQQLNTLADMVVPCNQSTGGTGSGSACGSLFSATTQGVFTSTYAPTDPWLAMASIAQDPNSSNTSSQLALISSPYYTTADSAVPTGGWYLTTINGVGPSITCPTENHSKSTSLTIYGTGLYVSDVNTIVVADGQAVIGTPTTDGLSVTFTVPTHLATGAIAVYQGGYATNACPFKRQ